MDVEELKKNRILVQYISIDSLPKKGLKRMQYFTSFEDDPEKFYWGVSVKKVSAYSKEKLEKWVKEGQLVKIAKSVNLTCEKDIWLNENNEIVLADFYNPWKDKEKKIVGSLR